MVVRDNGGAQEVNLLFVKQDVFQSDYCIIFLSIYIVISLRGIVQNRFVENFIIDLSHNKTVCSLFFPSKKYAQKLCRLVHTFNVYSDFSCTGNCK